MNAQSRMTCVAVCAAVCMSLFADSLFGGSRTVNTVEGLVAALAELNGDSANTITVAKGVYDVKDCAMEKAHLSVDKLTLKGATSDPRDVVIYDSAHANRIFYLNQGQIQNLTVSNGYLSTGHGAGILGSDHWSSRIENVVITCCDGPNAEGVACRTLAIVRNCQMIGNTGKYGGGAGDIYYGEYNGPRSGGLINCVIRDNAVTMSGGGVMNSTVSDSVIANNTAAKYGGGVFEQSACDYMRGCTIVSNSADKAGGGVYSSCTDSTAAKHYIVTNSLIAANFAVNCGGGVCFLSSNYADCLIDSVISNNVCDGTYDSSTLGLGGGGGVCRANVVGCMVIGNSVTNSVVTDTTRSSNGGGIYRCDFVTNCTIVGNSAVNNGGGAYNSKLIGCIVSNNLSHCYGGGVNGCAVTGSRIVHNLSENTKGVTKVAGGGGAYSSFVTNSLVAGNAVLPTSGRVAEACGGAGQDTVFSGCVVRDNYAAVGAAMQGGNAYDSTFSNNASKNGNYIFRQTKVFENCDICGGLIDSAAVLSNCRVHDFRTACYATIAPGANVVTSGVFAATSSSQTLLGIVADKTYALSATNTLFYGNQVDLLFWATAGNTLRLVNCTVVSNRADKTCTGVGMVDSGAAEMLNTMFVDNRTKDGSAARDYYPESKGNTNVVARNCIFGVGEKYALPRVMENCAMDKVVRFLPAADDGYPFQPKRQKCVTGAGLVEDWMATATDIRGEGFPRLRDGKVDIGCYQNWLPIPGMMMLFR